VGSRRHRSRPRTNASRADRRPISGPPLSSPAVENVLKAELQGDVARLRDFLGDGFDGWGIA